jgi:hypothetical protein
VSGHVQIIPPKGGSGTAWAAPPKPKEGPPAVTPPWTTWHGADDFKDWLEWSQTCVWNFRHVLDKITPHDAMQLYYAFKDAFWHKRTS